MLTDWKKNPTLELAEVEVVDIKPEEEITETWNEFFVSHHYGISNDIFKSYLFNHPRRSCDAFSEATLNLKPWHDNPFPRFKTLSELQAWIRPLIEEEEKVGRDGSAFSGDPTPPNKQA